MTTYHPEASSQNAQLLRQLEGHVLSLGDSALPSVSSQWSFSPSHVDDATVSHLKQAYVDTAARCVDALETIRGIKGEDLTPERQQVKIREAAQRYRVSLRTLNEGALRSAAALQDARDAWSPLQMELKAMVGAVQGNADRADAWFATFL
ncbi:MAG: hypothetical protein KF785_09400 [Gemmatimonadales bacterium]|nr:hypothetical protein [Gemmatimonadales bacterium]